MPLAVRGPGVPKGLTVSSMVLNIDFSPAFADIAGVAPPAFIDGRSFMPLFDDPASPWRRSFMIQRLGLETDERMKPANAIAVRTERYVYVAYNDGEHEMYDLEADPHQLDNIERTAPEDLKEALSTRLTELKTCTGEDCRTAEDAPIEELQP